MNPVKKLRVGILFGGRSGEHEVSLTSASSVIAAMDPDKYEVVPIGITPKGRWLLGSSSEKLLSGVLAHGKPVTVTTEPGRQGLMPLEANSTNPEKLDVVFPVLHGTFGEDGTVQGLLELAGIPYVGAGVLGSAVGMDKDVSKRLFREAKLPVIPWVTLRRGEWRSHPEKFRRLIEKKFRYPVFVKPANLGSSVGISKVHNRKELGPAVELAASYDTKVLVERAIRGREIECSVLGNAEPEASVPGEVIPVNEFYDYEAKYGKEGSELIIPAKLSARKTKEVQQLSLRAFQAAECAGMARVDFLLERRTGKVFLNEINTIPGFTPISMYPKLWEASGLPYRRLVDRLIDLALERQQEKDHTRFDYPAEQR